MELEESIGRESLSGGWSRWVVRRKNGLRSLTFLGFLFVCLWSGDGEARFASRFSLSVGEEYNDNIFFLKDKDHDFITQITPTLTLLYQPAQAIAPTFRFEISPTGQIFARHSELNNFGKNLTLGSFYDYLYSPRLSFHFTDALQLRDDTRTGGGGDGVGEVARPPTTSPRPGLSDSQRLGDFVSNGDTLANHFAFQGRYRYAQDLTFLGEYRTGYTSFLDRGGNELSNSIDLRGVYHWGKEHNIHAGYTVDIIKTREDDTNVVHNFIIGDDYFTTGQIQFTPTLTLSAATGVSLNTGSDGPRVANTTNVIITKLWETASLSGGVRKGLTDSFGVGGIADTTTFYMGFNIRLTDRLSSNAGVDYSLYDTDDVNFNTLKASARLQYGITPWLCSSLRYTHRRLDSGAGARNTDLQTRGETYSNSVFLTFSAHFDVWPTVGFAEAPGCPVGVPRPPAGFPQ